MGESPLEEPGRTVGRRLSDVLAGHMRQRSEAGGNRASAGGRVLAAVVAVAVLAGVAIGVGALLNSHSGSSSHTQPLAFNSSSPHASYVLTHSPGYPPSSAARHAPAVPPPPAGPYYPAAPPPAATYPPPGTYAPVRTRTAPPATTPAHRAATSPPARGVKAPRRSTVQRDARTSPPTTAPPTTAPPVQTYAVLSYASHRCISVVHNAPRVGASIDIWDCDNLPGQRWSYGENRTVRTLGMCMTISGNAVSGAPIVLAPCDGGANQQFYLNTAHDLVNPGADKCVDVKDKATHDGTHLQLWTCKGSSNQKWYVA